MPFGLSLSSSGLITGTPSSTGSASIQLRVTDASTGPGQYFEGEMLTINVVAAPSVSISVAPASVSEDGATNLVYTVTRSASLSSSTTVNITTSGTATAGTDYAGSVASVTIPSGATTATITINPTADTTVEANETVTLTVAAGSGYTVGAPSSATGTILNDDVPSASITVAPASVTEDGAANLVYTVALSSAPTSSVTVNYTVSGTATNGTDYAAITTSVVITAGSTSQTIVVNPNTDGSIEPDETAIITLAAGAGYTVGTPAAATGTILNDDLPGISVGNVSVAEGDAGTTNAVFTISLTAPAGASGVTFDIGTFNWSAMAGQDYVANSQTGVTIPAGQTSATFTVLVNGDMLNEPDEGFFVRISNVTGAFVNGSQAIGTIVNDDPLPVLSVNSPSILEGNSGTRSLNFALTLDRPSGQLVTVSVATANGTATAGSAYAA
ncbi:MAG: hypothetical protein IBJ13_01860, partial [Sphingopyxis sp.]|nr:hypothetical protein [Sphingopyxis sp.]